MPPNPWTAFTFFGIPLVLGLLGWLHSARLFWRVYRRRRVAPAVGPSPDSGPGPSSVRAQVLRGGALFLGSALLVVHSGRWLLSVYGYL